MAKTDVTHTPSSPLKKSKPTIAEPELIAAQEVVGREISIFQGSAKHPEWWDGKVVDFNADTAEHLIRYHREHRSEQWLELSRQPFQWKGKPPSSSAPNPTVKGIKLNDSILGRKVKVFWPTMSKWYLGCIKEYDAQTGQHTIKYKDGEVKDHALRNEAVWWLDSTDAKGTCSSPTSKGHSTASRGNSPDARQNSRRRHRSTGQGSGTTSSGYGVQQHSTTAETSHTHTAHKSQSKTDLRSGTAAVVEHKAAEPQTAVASADVAMKGKAESSAAADRDRHSGIFAAASGNADTDAENGYASQHSQLHDCAGELTLSVLTGP